jgi:hypothetical protein
VTKLIPAVAAALLAEGALAYTDAEVQRGVTLFQERCAACHRADGRGGPVPARFPGLDGLTAPRLAGPTALARFQTASDLAVYVRFDMPKEAPGSLSDAEALDVTTLLLSWNGIRSDGTALTIEGAGRILLHGAVTASALMPAARGAATAGSGYGSPGTYGGSSAYSYDRSSYPRDLVLRPMTLPARMVELSLPIGIDASTNGRGSPTTLHPSTYVGATDWLTLGLRTTSGFCQTDAEHRCTRQLDDLTVDSIWNLYRLGPVEAVYGASITAASIHDPLALSAEFRFALRVASSWGALWLAPTYGFGLTHRDTTSRIMPVAFPLTSALSFGTFQALPENRESVSVPLVVAAQPDGGGLTLAAGIALTGLVDPVVGRFADTYAIPLAFAVVVSPKASIDLGASLTFEDVGRNVAPPNRPSDARTLQVFLSARP